MLSNIKLRQWQSEAALQALDWLTVSKKDKRFLINAAPGAGKTICASVIAQKLIELGEIDRVIVIAPRVEVVRQWAEEFRLVTGRHMTKVTGADGEIEDYGVDLCATWSAVMGLLDGFQAVCKSSKTLVICDEHHHAAIAAAWGAGADGAFTDSRYVLVLTGTPIRSDGLDPVWFAYDDEGQIDHPAEGTYTLTYGKAVDLEYCRPITFHRHEGKFSVSIEDDTKIEVSGSTEVSLTPELKRVKGIQQALNFYRLVCTPKYKADGVTPDTNSYQASMLDWGIAKLNDLKDRVPDAGGLVIAPNIEVAEYMAALLEILDGEKPVIVHSQLANPDNRIAAYKNSKKRWLVSVAMVSEGVDIKRLRILIYLPNAQTELAFRQAMGRVVRNLGPDDDSRAYVVMPTHRIFEKYARRVEEEMSPAKRSEKEIAKSKVCPSCGVECDRKAKYCPVCEFEFPTRISKTKECDSCGALNPVAAKSCQNCGNSFKNEFFIELDEALRLGAIVRGMDLDEEEVQDSERRRDSIREDILQSGDNALIKILKTLPEESYSRLAKILNKE